MQASTSVAATQREAQAGSGISAHGHDVFVIGASAGGVPSLKALFAELPADFPGAIFVVVHVSPESPGEMRDVFARAGLSLPIVTPEDMAPIVPGRIYIAPRDRHMLIEAHRVRIVRGPKENRHRPAVDPLFRSAAWAYGPRVVGVVLTGYLNDGTAGLWAIKTCGGITVVQDPTDALYPDMPSNALLGSKVDHCVPLGQMAGLLLRLARSPAEPANHSPRPEGLKTEVEFAESERDIGDMDSLGKLSPFTCPGCGGALWELQDGDRLRYRCHTGHAFIADSLLLEQTSATERGLYAALRAVEEKAAALRRLRRHWNGKYPKTDADYEARAREMEESAAVLRKLLTEHDL